MSLKESLRNALALSGKDHFNFEPDHEAIDKILEEVDFEKIVESFMDSLIESKSTAGMEERFIELMVEYGDSYNPIYLNTLFIIASFSAEASVAEAVERALEKTPETDE